MSKKTSKVVEDNKRRFFEFYYNELDKFLLDYNSNEIIKTIDEEFKLYYSSDEEIKGQFDITIKKEPSKKIKTLVHQVFDNASRIDFENMEKLIFHLDKHFKFLIFLKKTNTDIFQLFSARRINNLFITAQKYNINLFYSFEKSGVLNELFSLMTETNVKLITSLLECLLQLTYTNMYELRNMEYEKYIPPSASQDSNASNGSSNGLGSVGSYGNNGIPLPSPHYTNQFNHGSPPKYSSPLNSRPPTNHHLDKPPIHTLTLLKDTCQDFYDKIIVFIFTNYSKCQFWMPRETYNVSLHLLNIGMELKETSKTLIITTLQYFTKATSLYNPYSLEWNISFYLAKSIHTMKQIMLFPCKQQGGSPTNKEKKRDLHWIFPLVDKLEASNVYTTSSQDYATSNINPLTTNNQIIIIDGRNWFYHKDYSSSNYINIKELQKYKTSNDFIKSIFPKIQHHFATVFKTNINPNYSSIIKCIFVFNEYHRGIIHQFNPEFMNMCVFTPQQQNANNDDIFCLYLWLSNPGSFILSNDQYRIYADKLMGYQYYLGLWKHWVNCFQINK